MTLLAVTVASRLFDAGLQIVVPVIGAFLMWLAHRLVKTVEAKTGLNIPDEYEMKLDNLVTLGIHYAEEKASVFLKEKGEKMAGPEKLEIAGNFVLDLADQYKLTDLAAAKVKQLVEAKLGIMRQDPTTETSVPNFVPNPVDEEINANE